MKSYSHLYETYLSHENYLAAVHNATLHKGGKARKNDKAKWYRDHAEQIEGKMMDYAEHFKSDEHKSILIYDGIRRKQRYIVVPNMREQIVHHMVINVLKPIFMKGMYEHSYGSVPGRGAHAGKKTIEKWIRQDGRNVKYCLKMDIRKYFDSIPHNILKEKLRKVIRDARFMRVLEEIIDTADGERGIPIGFYTSQWLANWYLTDLDHWVKETLKAKHYIRYMDDMVIFGGNKRELHRMRREIETYLRDKLGLEMKDNWQVFRFDYVKKNGKRIGRDLDFMGFRFYRDKTVLRRNLMLKMTRKARRISRKDVKTIHDCRQMLSYLGWIDCTDTYGLYRKRVKPHVCFGYLKRRISQYERKMNREKKAREMQNDDLVQMHQRGKREAGGGGHHQQPEMGVCAEGFPAGCGDGGHSGTLGVDGTENSAGNAGIVYQNR